MIPTLRFLSCQGFRPQAGVTNPWGVPHNSEISGFNALLEEGDWGTIVQNVLLISYRKSFDVAVPDCLMLSPTQDAWHCTYM